MDFAEWSESGSSLEFLEVAESGLEVAELFLEPFSDFAELPLEVAELFLEPFSDFAEPPLEVSAASVGDPALDPAVVLLGEPEPALLLFASEPAALFAALVLDVADLEPLLAEVVRDEAAAEPAGEAALCFDSVSESAMLYSLGTHADCYTEKQVLQLCLHATQ